VLIHVWAHRPIPVLIRAPIPMRIRGWARAPTPVPIRGLILVPILALIRGWARVPIGR